MSCISSHSLSHARKASVLIVIRPSPEISSPHPMDSWDTPRGGGPRFRPCGREPPCHRPPTPCHRPPPPCHRPPTPCHRPPTPCRLPMEVVPSRVSEAEAASRLRVSTCSP